jgi:TfoX/Sxy family transcriptional regulator of competence genes
MAWVKIPAEHHPLFRAALPKDPRIQTLNMFGGVAAKIAGKMFAGLFARSAIVRLTGADYDEAVALDGAEKFDPMGHGPSKDMVLLPEDVFQDDDALRAWLVRAMKSTLATQTAPKAPKASRPARPRPAKPRAAAAPKRRRSSASRRASRS